jgi:uncharacterized protein (TIGR03790 family)
MKRTLLGLLLAMLLPVAPAGGADDAERVLILVNDTVPPEAGTGRKGASAFVGEHYADRRGVPRSNIVHLTIPLACCENDPRARDSWNLRWETFEQHVRTPLRRFLEQRRLTDRILYLVSTYGVPLRVGGGPFGKIDGVSVDSVLAAMHAGRHVLGLRNPYQAGVEERKAHFRDWTNPLGWKMYLVTRLDGPSALIATGLVDKAIKAEASLQKTDGTGYFDYRHLGGSDGYARDDQTMLNAYQLSAARGFASVLNDQTQTGAMIRKAPRTLWAWGWYSGPNTWDGYEFVDGAVGAQLTSYTANSVRTMAPGTWVPVWLSAGITATWGATGEPTVEGYAMGDNLLNHFWMGYNFAESSYLASPALNHMMVFIGDPLYAPRIFRAASVP